MFTEVFWGALFGLIVGKLIWRLVEWFLGGHFKEMGKAEKKLAAIKKGDQRRDRRGRRQMKSELIDASGLGAVGYDAVEMRMKEARDVEEEDR